MSRPSAPRARTRLERDSRVRKQDSRNAPRRPWRSWVAAAGLFGVVGLLLLIGLAGKPDGKRLRTAAETAARRGDLVRARELWHRLNATSEATAATLVAEGRACLALGRAAEAERILTRAIEANPLDPEPWVLRMEILRVEDRSLEALHLGWEAYDRVDPATRREVLRELMLSALADLPPDLVRATLQRWIEADPEDLDAQAALLRRIAADPRSGDPDRQTRINELFRRLAQHPRHIGTREALVEMLGDAGEADQGRALLDDWPEDHRDARYWRLRGRWDLEYDQRADQAVSALRTALADLPHDWRSRFRLARALRICGMEDAARREAETVARLREILDPSTLGPRLDAALAHLDQDSSVRVLADLCARAGLSRLSDAWRATLNGPAAVAVPIRPGEPPFGRPVPP